MKWKLDRKDVVLLAAYLGGDKIIGVDDPFLGWLAEQVEAQWQKTRQALIKKGLALPVEKDDLSVDPELKEALAICCHPQQFVSIGIYADVQQVKTTYNIAKSKHVVIEEAGDSAIISSNDHTPNSLREAIAETLALPSQAERFLESTVISETAVAAYSGDKGSGKPYSDSMISDMLYQPDKKILIVMGDFNPGGAGIRTFGIYVKAGKILRLDETGSGALGLRSVTAADVLTEIARN